jgi:hypothetical protein
MANTFGHDVTFLLTKQKLLLNFVAKHEQVDHC